ncbi:hypothetical protein J3R83DRAFT_8348 [Lanmaoa asiatica]|nr:hypothetical protein J3R83DRAFT_8348 [Lanmaoa asiatica]
MSVSYGISTQWTPVLIGFILSTFMYGTALGQSIYYIYTFPDDPNSIKALVLGVMWPGRQCLSGWECPFLLDLLCVVSSKQLVELRAQLTVGFDCYGMHQWCHRFYRAVVSPTAIAYGQVVAVNRSLAHNDVCIVSGQNKLPTFAIFVLAILGFGAGVWYNIDLFVLFPPPNYGRSIHFIAYDLEPSNTYISLALPINIIDALCDLLITSAIFKYMWKSGFRRQCSAIQDLVIVCINGSLYLLNINNHRYHGAVGLWVGSVGMVVGQSKYKFPMPDGTMLILGDVCYVNSMSAVLNARKAIRDRDPNIYGLSII